MRIIIGANYGDEGKGVTTAHFCNENTLNILTNGGAQRGHTADGHVFHHLGSGTLRGAKSYFFKTFLLDPVMFLKEYGELKKKTDIIAYRDAGCRWVTPYDVLVNQELERKRTFKHGSCGMGIWETVNRHNNMLCWTIDIFNESSKADKVAYLTTVRDYALNRLGDDISAETLDLMYSDILMENFIDDVATFCMFVPVRNLHDFNNYELVFENAQGLLLNADEKNVHTTPSCTGCKNVVQFIEDEYINQKVEIIYVTRPYLTRHGAGPFEECSREELGVAEDTTNIPNEFQGSIRYGKLNVEELIERIDKDFANTNGSINTYYKSISITHLDEMPLYLTSDFYNTYKFNGVESNDEDFRKILR